MYDPEPSKSELGFAKSSQQFFIFNFMRVTKKYDVNFTSSINEQRNLPINFMGNVG